jgi:drug/metabolite transporter (DMT)-like permease
VNKGTIAEVSTTNAGLAAVAVAMVGWAFTPIVVKLTSLEGLAVSFYRLWLGLPLMFAALALARRRFTKETLRTSLASGALFGLNNAFFFSAVKLTSVANVSLISNMQPALILLVAGPWFGERIRGREIAWTITSIGGVALVVLGSAGLPVWSPKGDLLAVACLISWCAFFLLTKRLRARVGSLEYMTGVLIGAAMVMTPLTLISGQDLTIGRTQDFVWLAILIVLANGGHLLMTWAHRHVDVSVSSVILLGSPAVAAIAALLILGEALSPLQIAGGVMVLVGVGAVARRAARVAESEPVASS